jgi:hypothetical protein
MALHTDRYRLPDLRRLSLRVAILVGLLSAALFPGCSDHSPSWPHDPCDGQTFQPCPTPDLGLPFTNAGNFSEGVAWVKLTGGGYGVIDTTGKLLFPTSYPVYDFDDGTGRNEFHEGVIVCRDGWPERYGLLDRFGNTVLAPSYAYIGAFSNSRAVAQPGTDGPYGFLDRTGSLAIPAAYYRAGDFSEGLACVAVDSLHYGYVDPSGAFVIPATYLDGGRFSEGLAPVLTADSAWKYIDNTGAIVLNMDSLGYCRSFSEGRAAVRSRTGSRWAFIDNSGRRVTGWTYKSAVVGDFHDGLCGIRIGGGWGPPWDEYIDRSGNTVFEYRYLPGSFDYSDGYTPVQNCCYDCTTEYWTMGMIDRTGTVVIPIRFEWVGRYRNGWFPLKTAGRAGFMNLKGKIMGR